MMDDLNENPEKVAEDIIKQAKSGFVSEATQRIIRMLTAYHQLREELTEFKKLQETESSISYDGNSAWKTVKGQKDGPFCTGCHIREKELFRLIDQKNGLWRCAKCNQCWKGPTYQEPNDIYRIV